MRRSALFLVVSSLVSLVIGQPEYDDIGMENDGEQTADFISVEACAKKLPEGRLKNFIANEAPAFRNAFVHCDPRSPGKQAYVMFFGHQGQSLGAGDRVLLPELDGEDMLKWMNEKFSFEAVRKMAVYKEPHYSGKFDGHTIQFWALKDTFTGAFEHATMTPLNHVSGYLIHVESAEEREFVNKILEETVPGQNASIWVGAHNTANPGQDPEFRYLGGKNDGSVVNFESLGLPGDWHFTHKPREGNGRDCLVYNYSPAGASWGIADCETSTAYTIVEHDPMPQAGAMGMQGGQMMDDYQDDLGMDNSHYRGAGAQDPHYDESARLADDLEEGWRDEL